MAETQASESYSKPARPVRSDSLYYHKSKPLCSRQNKGDDTWGFTFIFFIIFMIAV